VRRQLSGNFVKGALLAGPDTAYYVPSDTAQSSDRVLALAARTGDERWQAADGPHGTVPGLVADGALYCAQSDEATAWDATTGALRWRWTERPDSVSAEPYAQQLRVADRAGDTVVLLGTLSTSVGRDVERQYVVVALDLRDGTLRWRLELPHSRSTARAGPVALADGSVAVGIGPAVHLIGL
jgi:outer membrane protein assembly factor BamB